jgi:hypothetical protein
MQSDVVSIDRHGCTQVKGIAWVGRAQMGELATVQRGLDPEPLFH